MAGPDSPGRRRAARPPGRATGAAPPDPVGRPAPRAARRSAIGPGPTSPRSAAARALPRTTTSTTSRRPRRRCRGWTRSPRAPGRRCSAGPATCSSPCWSTGRSRTGQHSGRRRVRRRIRDAGGAARRPAAAGLRTRRRGGGLGHQARLPQAAGQRFLSQVRGADHAGVGTELGQRDLRQRPVVRRSAPFSNAARAGPSSRSPASTRRRRSRSSPGRGSRPGRPGPGRARCPTISKQRSAAGSPSLAAWVICGPSIAVGVPAAELQQPDRAARGAPGEVARLRHQGAAAGVLLPAAAVAAAAQPAVGYHPVVPGLAGHAPAAPVEPAVEHDAAADAGADGDERGRARGRAPHRAWPRPRRWRCASFSTTTGRPDAVLDLLAAAARPARPGSARTHGGAGLVDEAGRPDADRASTW